MKLASQGAAAEDTAADANAMAEEGPARTKKGVVKEVAAAEVVAPRTATDKTAAEEVAAAEAPSNQVGQGDPRETAEEVMEEASAGVGRGGYQANSIQLDSTHKNSLINEPAQLNSLTKQALNPNSAQLI
jgi:hypothetical protein